MALLQAITKYGMVQGMPQEGTQFSVFKGIPYAKAPFGQYRFQPPMEPDKWQGVRICDTFSPAPIQGFRPGEKPFAVSEDCLYLNVFTPAQNANEKLPVMVWIYGGGFQGGNGADPEFDGKAINKEGVILVNINYRVGALGFIANKKLGSANLGLLDQIAALRWVKENIAAFGGDGENITIFGQSAGGMSCRMLITSPLTKGLIQKAIVQSGGGLNEADPIKTKEEFMQMCDQALAHLGWDEADLMERDASEIAMKMHEAARECAGRFQVGFFQPFIDELTMVDVPGKLIKEGKYNGVKVIDGTVAGDSWMFSSSVKNELEGNVNYFRGFSFAGQLAWAKVRAQRGEEAIYTYYMDRKQPPKKSMGSMQHGLPPYGADTPHSTEIAYIFGTLGYRQLKHDGEFTEYDRELSRVMTKYWTNFAKTGDPNGEGLAFWPKSEGEKPLSMHFGNEDYKAEYIVKSKEEEQAVNYTIEHPGLLTSVEGLKEI